MHLVPLQTEVVQQPSNQQIYTAGQHQIELSVTAIPNGVYWIQIQTNEGVWSRQLVVQK